MSKVKGNVIDPLDVVYGATLPQLLQKAKDGLAPESALENIRRSRFRPGLPPGPTRCASLAALAAQGATFDCRSARRRQSPLRQQDVERHALRS